MLFEKLGDAIRKGDVSIVGAFADLLKPLETDTRSMLQMKLLTDGSPIRTKLHETLRHFYNRYDHDKSGSIDERCAVPSVVSTRPSR